MKTSPKTNSHPAQSKALGELLLAANSYANDVWRENTWGNGLLKQMSADLNYSVMH